MAEQQTGGIDHYGKPGWTVIDSTPDYLANTPWGAAQTISHLGQGVYGVTTANHGGIYVPVTLLPKISWYGRGMAMRWARDEQWYEEDCCWAFVADALPELFKGEVVNTARELLYNMAQR